MQFTSDTPRKSRTIAGLVVTVIAPYAAGQTIGEGEAQMLNQTLAENFSNNLREKLEKFVPQAPEGKPYGEGNPAPEPRKATPEEAQALVDAYAAAYTPGVRQGGGSGARALTPLEKEVRNIATEKLTQLLQDQKIKRSDVNFNDLRDQIIKEHNEALTAQATKIIKARENANKGTALDLGGILGAIADGGTKPEEVSDDTTE